MVVRGSGTRPRAARIVHFAPRDFDRTAADFRSKNCMIELRASAKMGKLIIALVEPDASKGGLTQSQVHEQLIEAETSLYQKWLFDEGPSAEELYAALYKHEPIEWNRIGAFQDV